MNARAWVLYMQQCETHGVLAVSLLEVEKGKASEREHAPWPVSVRSYCLNLTEAKKIKQKCCIYKSKLRHFYIKIP